MELTKDQKRAAAATGSAAVSAGAGTGKTRMLAQRYLHHIRAHEFSPLSIVAITFTEKAADELRSRIRKTLSAELKDEKIIAEVEAAQISTIHSLAARICRDFYDLAGIPPDFSVLDETESPLWTSEKFDEAMGKIDPAIIEAISSASVLHLTSYFHPALRTHSWYRSTIAAASAFYRPVRAGAGIRSKTRWN